MISVELQRIKEDRYCTQGILTVVHGEPIRGISFFTLEPAWRDNARSEDPFKASCIPVGRYLCCRHESPKFGHTFLLCNVPKRSEIIFHAGNFAKNTRGCILIGEKMGYDDFSNYAVYSSRQAMKQFMHKLRGIDNFYLDVRGVNEIKED